MYIIRADGNAAVGMGHVMRCLSIADAMKEAGIEPLFMTACADCISMIKNRGYQTYLLHTDYQNMEAELPIIQGYLQGQEKSHVILVDSYQVTWQYYLGLKELAKVACLEDMGQSYPVDLLINYNIYAPALLYDNKIVQEALLGTKYQPLRKEFQKDAAVEIKRKITNVMITTGGNDPYFAAQSITDAFLADKKLQAAGLVYHIISGPFNIHAQDLHRLYDEEPCVVIQEHVTCMKDIMEQCDVVISAAGSTIYEVCALGIPLIAFYYAENQRQGAEALAQRTHVINCGNYAQKPHETVQAAQEALLRCVEEDKYRYCLQQEERRLVDGAGAARIAQALKQLGEALAKERIGNEDKKAD